MIRAALPTSAQGRDPSILIILSSSVREPIAGLTISNVLRPGLAGLIKSLTAEIAPIRINGLAPGRFATDRIAYLDGRRAEAAGVTPEEIARRTRPTSRSAATATRRRSAGRRVPAVARRLVRHGRDRRRGRGMILFAFSRRRPRPPIRR